MNSNSRGLKLYVYIDNQDSDAVNPMLIVTSKQKNIRDLKYWMEEKYNYCYEEQHWIIDGVYCLDDYKLEDIVVNMNQVKDGYVAFLFLITEESANELPSVIMIHTESKYEFDFRRLDEWNEVYAVEVFSESISPEQAICPKWSCETCTMLNKFFMKYCNVCGNARPNTYQQPTNFYLTEEDNEELEREKQKELKEKQKEEEARERLKQIKEKYRLKLLTFSKQDIIYSSEKTECPICVMDYEPGGSIVLHSCAHTICRDCLKNVITANNSPKITCPYDGCAGTVDHREIAAILTKEELAKYQELSMKSVEALMENTFHCKTENCPMFVENDENVNYFHCPKCKKINCINCGAIHENKTCEEYQNGIINAALQKDLELLNREIAQGLVQRCPFCRVAIRKRNGCRHMTCNNCRGSFQWTGQDIKF